ncbi:hypothetical protein [Immundisolibacter sp.]
MARLDIDTTGMDVRMPSGGGTHPDLVNRQTRVPAHQLTGPSFKS